MISVAKRYNVVSRFYDAIEKFAETRFLSKFRERLFELVQFDGRILEVGIGTGRNLPFYPEDANLVGIDFSSGMLRICEQKVKKLGLKNVELHHMDVQEMGFPDEYFDTVISTFVFCTVPDPLKGLKEVYRVLKKGKYAYFLEHMRSERWYLNLFLGMMNLVTKPLLGTSMLRETRDNILRAGFTMVHEENLMNDVVKLMIVRR